MRRSLCFALCLCILPTCLRADDAPAAVPQEALAAFTRNLAVAEWMVAYDHIAWVTSDEIIAAPKERQARLGPAWFCFKSDDGWHAVYGRLSEDSKQFEVAFHYRVDANDTISELPTDQTDPAWLPLAQAVTTAREKVLLPTFKEFGMLLNPYARRVGESIEVWLIPAWQENKVIGLGRTHRLEFSADGKTLQTQDCWDYGLRGVRPDKEADVAIGNRKFAYPTVGDIFFVLTYGRMFATVKIESTTFFSTLVPTEAGAIWMHVLTPPEFQEEAGKKKKTGTTE